MAEQELLTGPARPADGGLWARYITDGHINEAAWRNACDGGGLVGTCTGCGGYLRPQPPEKQRGRTDYTAVCTSCDREICAPGGRINRARKPRTGA